MHITAPVTMAMPIYPMPVARPSVMARKMQVMSRAEPAAERNRTKAERAGDSHACAEVAVHEQNDNLHHCGQQRQRDRHGLRVGVFVHINGGNEVRRAQAPPANR